MKLRWVEVVTAGTLAVSAGVAGCKGKESAEGAADWYRPWFSEKGQEAAPEEGQVTVGPVTELQAEPNAAAVAEGRGTAAPNEAASDLPPSGDAGDGTVAGAGAVTADANGTTAQDTPDGREVQVKVKRDESVRLYSRWSGVPEDELRKLNDLGPKRGLRVGAAFKMLLTPAAHRRFEQARQEHFERMEKDFFARFEVVKVLRYTMSKGDNLWKISKKYDNVPIWLIERFNQHNETAGMMPGAEIFVPQVQQIGKNGESPAVGLWGDVPMKPRPADAAGGAVAEADDEGAAPPVAKGKGDKTDPKEVAPRDDAPGKALVIKVESRETLGLYSRWAQVSIKAILAENPGLDANKLFAGQKIRVPVPEARLAEFYKARRRFIGGEPAEVAREAPKDKKVVNEAPKKAGVRYAKHTVKKGESAWLIAVKRYNISIKDLEQANPDKKLASLREGEVLNIPRALPGGSAHKSLPSASGQEKKATKGDKPGKKSKAHVKKKPKAKKKAHKSPKTSAPKGRADASPNFE